MSADLLRSRHCPISHSPVLLDTVCPRLSCKMSSGYLNAPKPQRLQVTEAGSSHLAGSNVHALRCKTTITFREVKATY